MNDFVEKVALTSKITKEKNINSTVLLFKEIKSFVTRIVYLKSITGLENIQ
jgi:hypothetical protein